jgi:mannosylglycerate hydrolase
MTREVVVVPHTHWDREWYAPFQTFRLRLVDLLDDLLPRLEADPSYGHFLLDGQMAVVDDYLAVRPGAEPAIRRLAVSGRLAMGPWYILMDEFLVSGETMIRDLQLGLERAAAFGGAMAVGYLPDMFGHIAQMPQILSQFGLDHAVVWRGVPRAMSTPAFWWEAPDGSTVRAQYLPEGYGNGASLPEDAGELVAMIRRFEDTYGPLAGGAEDGPLLWMNGTDHQTPRPWLGRVVAEANAMQDDYHLRVGALADYLAAAPTDGLDLVHGELRSGARSNLLMGVASNRTDVRRASVVAERGLERLAEPLSALWLAPDRWPAALLAEAWKLVVLNSAHDSVCACSVDDVVDAVLHRYAEARHLAEGLTERAVAALARSVDSSRPLAVNASARVRGGLVELTIPGDGPIPGTQLLRQFPSEFSFDGPTCADLLPVVQGALDGFDDIVDGSIEVDVDGVTQVRLHRDSTRAHGKWNGPVRGTMMARAAEQPTAPARFTISRPSARRILVRVADVPGFGWRSVPDVGAGEPVDPHSPVTVDGLTISNGLVTVEIDADQGTFSIDGHRGLGRLVDDGDIGDTYNYCPPASDVIVREPRALVTDALEAGPLRARVQLRATYEWPERVVDQRRVGERVVVVTTTIELQAGERLVRVTHHLDNACRDHRLRAWFPLPEPATESRAECAFAVVSRGLEAEGGPNEPPLPTYPSRRFVQAGGLTVVHEGLTEYELVDVTLPSDAAPHAATLALTLLRCTGMLSQGPMASRPLPAGPTIAIEGPQMAGPQTMRYAVQVGDRDPYALVDDAFLPLLVADVVGVDPEAADGGSTDADLTGPDHGSALDIRGAEVSSVTRVGGQIQVRVWNPTDEEVTVTVDDRSGWLVDLRGATIAPFTGSFELGPWRIATAVLT